VDDLTIAAARLDSLEEFKEMSKRYDMKDLGELHFILGPQVTRDRAKRSLSLCQTQYIDSILTRFNMQDCKPAKYPLRAKTILKPRAADEEKADLVLYLAFVGSFMYAMLGTRQDIAYAVGLLGRFSSDPSREHWMANPLSTSPSTPCSISCARSTSPDLSPFFGRRWSAQA
jgi:hypothetical protein